VCVCVFLHVCKEARECANCVQFSKYDCVQSRNESEFECVSLSYLPVQ